MPKSRLVHIRVKKRSAISERQVNSLNLTLEKLGYQLSDVHVYQGGGGLGATECGQHSCSGFQPGGGDCTQQGSRCEAEACTTQSCSAHGCDNNSCNTEACSGHICDIHEKKFGSVYASMTKSSKAFADLQTALKAMPGDVEGGISLAIH